MNRPKTKVSDLSVCKFRVTPEMVGGECLLVTDGRDNEIRWDAVYNATLQIVGPDRARSYEQLKLYWRCCQLVADNTDDINWSTKEKVDEQVKIAARHYEFWTYYENQKTGETCLNIKTRSISYAELPHLEACGFFEDAFFIMAQKLGTTVDEMMAEISGHES